MWNCVCDCGKAKEKPVSVTDLRSGKVVSCGCFRKETAPKNGLKPTHGMTGSRLWVIWCSMKRRCKVNPHYSDVSVCKEWEKFDCFYEWAMQNGYSESLTLDRIDPYGNYEPKNCRWETWAQQENNRRNNRLILYKGDVYTLSQLSGKLNIGAQTLRSRIFEYNWPETDWDIPANLANKFIRRRKHA